MPGYQSNKSPILKLKLLALVNPAVLAMSIFLGPLGSLLTLGAVSLVLFAVISEIGFVVFTTLISHIVLVPGLEFGTVRLIKWIAVAILFGITAWQFTVRTQSIKSPFGFMEKYVVIFIVWGFVCLFFSDYPVASVAEFLRLLLLYMIYWITFQTVRTKRGVILVLSMFVLVAFSSSLYSIGELVAEGSYSRVRGFMDNANGFGEFLAIVIPFVVAAAVLARNRMLRYFLVFASILSTMALALSWSRAAIGAAIIQFVVFLVAERKYRALMISGFASVLAIVAILAIPTVFDLFSTAARLQFGTTHRVTLWEAGINSIGESPIVGHGFEVRVSDIIGRVHWNDLSASAVFKDEGGRFYAHNQFVQSAVATGIPGLILFLGFMYYLIKYSIRDYKWAEKKRVRVLYSALLSVEFGMIFFCFFAGAPLFGAGSYANYFWVAAGMLQAVREHDIDI